MPVAPMAMAAFASATFVDVSQEFQRRAVGGHGGVVAVFGELILEVKEFAFEFAERAERFRRRVNQDMAVAAIDHHGVASLYVPQDVAKAAYGWDTTAASDNRRVAGLTTGLRYDRAHIHIAKRHRLGWQQFVRYDDERTREHSGLGLQDVGQMSA